MSEPADWNTSRWDRGGGTDWNLSSPTLRQSLVKCCNHLALILSPRRLEVRSSNKSRSINSGASFLEGFLNLGEDPVSAPQLRLDNHLLRFYDECPRWSQEVDEAEATLAEARELRAGAAWAGMVAGVEARAGLGVGAELASLAWDMCRYERAWAARPAQLPAWPAWCALFSMEDHRLLEFGDDLELFYSNGPAYEINGRMSQPLFEASTFTPHNDPQHYMPQHQDLFSAISTMENGEETGIVLNFAHDTTLQHMMAALRLFNDGRDLRVSWHIIAFTIH